MMSHLMSMDRETKSSIVGVVVAAAPTSVSLPEKVMALKREQTIETMLRADGGAEYRWSERGA